MFQRKTSCISYKCQQQREGCKIGDLIYVDDEHVSCGQCDELNGDIPRRVEGLCQECWGRFERQGRQVSLQYTSKLKTIQPLTYQEMADRREKSDHFLFSDVVC